MTELLLQVLKNASKPMVIVGSSVLQQVNGLSLYSSVVELCNSLKPTDKQWNVLNVLHRVASQVGALDVGYRAGVGDISNTKLLYLLGAVELTYNNSNYACLAN